MKNIIGFKRQSPNPVIAIINASVISSSVFLTGWDLMNSSVYQTTDSFYKLNIAIFYIQQSVSQQSTILHYIS